MIVMNPSSQAGQSRIYRTTDGAKHWKQQLAGQSQFPGFSPIAVQLFGKRGFMSVGGSVEQFYRTSDGGVHWDPQLLPADHVDSITFGNAPSGWLLAYTGSGLPGPLQSHLYATSDAGQTWQPRADPPTDSVSLGFRSPTDAWMGSSDAQLPHVYSSSDLGRSWQRHDLPKASGLLATDRYSHITIQLLPAAGVLATVEAIRCDLLPVSPDGSGAACPSFTM